LLQVLLDKGANPKEIASRRKGTSLLHMMTSCDRPRGALLLLDAGADPNVRDNDGKMPLHVAATLGNISICSMLVRHEQCDVNALDYDGGNLLTNNALVSLF
jgi:ankyrin repeat protein